ncbi:MAG: hypothetical protein F2567_08800 [Actinobacteria bacterium]|uniref:Unannotated protein n=1 Tax=freshwater metagenome TaxID=449393 RepID=A0A6J6A111_9ZZZZ|nr:hypothetical protein [Actinomycetota bacterium]MTA43119.1 hypothetical protein [Actinomycetota bacterium]
MGLFGGKKRTWVAGPIAADEPFVDLSGFDLQNLLYTAGGSYHFRVHTDHIAESCAIFKKNFAKYRYPEWWEGTAYLVHGKSNGHEVIWVRVQGVNVDKLTKTTLDEIRDLVKTPVPVRCKLTTMGTKSNPRPSVVISALAQKRRSQLQ